MARARTLDPKRSIPSSVSVIFLFIVAAAIVSPAQTFKTLYNFCGGLGGDCTDSVSNAALIQSTDGKFYGAATSGGANGYGMVFRITPGGTLTELYSFCSQTNCTDGANPGYGLVQGTDGNFYGTTLGGGAYACADSSQGGCGTVFKITPAGTLTTLHSFDNVHGAYPNGALVQGAAGSFYGTTLGGGPNCQTEVGCGTVFKITPEGTLTTLHNFDGNDGELLYGGLVQGTDGNFYGTTSSGGANQTCSVFCGTIFKITPAGALTTLHNFDGTDGAYPEGPLVQATNGNFYGTTAGGGEHTGGTVFKLTPKGTLTSLYSFCATDGCADGYNPQAGLVQGTDGNFYGTAEVGGTNYYYGTAFRITPGGTLTVLHSFDGTDGENPFAGLLQATNGVFYGTTNGGGKGDCSDYGCGTVFEVSVGLGPFVKTEPTSGKVGARVVILGNNLTGLTAVSFNGTAATFRVMSSTEITATVPTGATTGALEVTTPTKLLKSNVAFRVAP